MVKYKIAPFDLDQRVIAQNAQLQVPFTDCAGRQNIVLFTWRFAPIIIKGVVVSFDIEAGYHGPVQGAFWI
jgi:hypothetical protein